MGWPVHFLELLFAFLSSIFASCRDLWLTRGLCWVLLPLVLILRLFGVSFADASDRGAVRPAVTRRPFLIQYLMGLGIALLILAGAAGLALLAIVSYPIALALASAVLAGLLGLMVVLVVRYYRRPQP